VVPSIPSPIIRDGTNVDEEMDTHLKEGEIPNKGDAIDAVASFGKAVEELMIEPTSDIWPLAPMKRIIIKHSTPAISAIPPIAISKPPLASILLPTLIEASTF